MNAFKDQAGDERTQLQTNEGTGARMDINMKVSGSFADFEFETRRGSPPPPERLCSCNSGNIPKWRTGPDGHSILCNACGLRMLSDHINMMLH